MFLAIMQRDDLGIGRIRYRLADAEELDVAAMGAEVGAYTIQRASALEFLRGNPTNEGVALGQFRVRATATFGENFLGDIVDSQPVYVQAPFAQS